MMGGWEGFKVFAVACILVIGMSQIAVLLFKPSKTIPPPPSTERPESTVIDARPDELCFYLGSENVE